MNTQIKKCLLVDDDQDDREIFQIAVTETGNNIECYFHSNANDAINSLKAKIYRPDIIFLDLNMPMMTGIQCLIEIKKIEFISQTPIIIYSTSSDPRFHSEALMNGASAYITKPHKLSELVSILKTTFKRELGEMPS